MEKIIKYYQDFPKKGINFVDILPFLHNKEAFQKVICDIDKLCTAPNVTAIEARGFLFSTPLLVSSQKVKALLPIRKKGKTPFVEGDLQKVEITKEYGKDELYYRRSDIAALVKNGDTIEISVFDDLLATGGTTLELAKSFEKETIDGCRVKIKEFVFLVELPYLGGAALLEKIAPVRSLIKIEEE